MVLRLAYHASAFWALLTLTFLLFRVLPGDPARLQLGLHADEASVARLRHALGLDRPLWVQYGDFLWSALRLRLGHSLESGEPVALLLREHFRVTGPLSLLGLGLATGLSLLGGGALHLRGRLAGLMEGVRLVMASMPVLFSGLLLALLFGYAWPLFPLSGPLGWRRLFLPAVAIALGPAAVLARVLRESVEEVEAQPYILTARAFGLPESRVRLYILRNALTAWTAALSNQAAVLLTGAFLVENIFALPGMGWLAVRAIFRRDLAVLQGIVLWNGTLVILVHLVADIAYRLLNPGPPILVRGYPERSRWQPVAVFMAGLVVLSFLALKMAPYSPVRMEAAPLRPPSADHPLGTDDLGRDVFSRTLHGLHRTLRISLAALVLSLVSGVAVGAWAGFHHGRWPDRLVSWWTSVLMALPGLLLLMGVMAVVEPGATGAYLALSAVLWVIPARIVRGEVVRLRTAAFVEAERVLGVPTARIVFGTVLPMAFRPALVASLGLLAELVGLEAGLAFLGLGVQPPEPSLGKMVFDGLSLLGSAWWTSVPPAAVLFGLVLALNGVGSWTALRR